MFSSASLIANSVQLVDIVDRMAKGQMDLSRGALMLMMNFMQLSSAIYILVSAHVAHTAAIWAHTIAQQARGVATAIADAIATMGLSIPLMIAVSAAAGVAASAAFAAVPHAAQGGVFTHPTVALIAEKGPEAVIPVGGVGGGVALVKQGTTNIYITVNGAKEPRETGEAIVNALRSAGVI